MISGSPPPPLVKAWPWLPPTRAISNVCPAWTSFRSEARHSGIRRAGEDLFQREDLRAGDAEAPRQALEGLVGWVALAFLQPRDLSGVDPAGPGQLALTEVLRFPQEPDRLAEAVARDFRSGTHRSAYRIEFQLRFEWSR